MHLFPNSRSLTLWLLQSASASFAVQESSLDNHFVLGFFSSVLMIQLNNWTVSSLRQSVLHRNSSHLHQVYFTLRKNKLWQQFSYWTFLIETVKKAFFFLSDLPFKDIPLCTGGKLFLTCTLHSEVHVASLTIFMGSWSRSWFNSCAELVWQYYAKAWKLFFPVTVWSS